jgi:sigma-B regulation protein RsbU (phosphoserine phosphatase)
LQFGIEGELRDLSDDFFNTARKSPSLSINTSGQKESFDISIPVFHEEEPIAHLLVGDKGEESIGVSPVIKHMNFIETITNIILVAIRNRKFAEENIKQERVRKELELAAEMQAILVPHELPKNEIFEVAAVYMPHQQVGGDYYDFMYLNEHEFMFCMADVSGKGVSAAFLMSNFQAYLRAIFNYLSMPLEDVIRELNAKVMRSAMGEKYITFFIGTYNTQTRDLHYINCGHNPPVFALPSGQTSLLGLGSVGLGMFDEIPNIHKGYIKVPEGACIVCYTDGLVELEDETNQEYGVERLQRLIVEHLNDDMDTLNSHIMKDVNRFKGTMPYIDDTALLSCRFF